MLASGALLWLAQRDIPDRYRVRRLDRHRGGGHLPHRHPDLSGPGIATTYRVGRADRGRRRWTQARHSVTAYGLALKRVFTLSSQAATPMDLSLYLSEQHFQVRDMVREFGRTEVAPVARELDRTSTFPWDNIRKMADLGLARRAVERGAGWGGDGPAVLLHHHPRAGQGGREPRPHDQRAYQPRHLADHGLRHPGAEGAVRPAARVRQGARRVRADRAGRGQRRRRHGHDGRRQGRPLPAQRLQDLHHPRGRGRDLQRHGADRAREGQPGHHQPAGHQGHGRPGRGQAGRGRPRAPTCPRSRVSGRARRKTRWAGGRATPASWSSRTRSSRRRTSWARWATGS